MNLKQAHEALIAAGYDTRLLLADDESTDDAFAIGEGDKVQVQVSATRNGLHFSAAVDHVGAGRVGLRSPAGSGDVARSEGADQQ